MAAGDRLGQWGTKSFIDQLCRQIWPMLGVCWSRHHSMSCHWTSLQVSAKFLHIWIFILFTIFECLSLTILAAFCPYLELVQARHLLLFGPRHRCKLDHWQILRWGGRKCWLNFQCISKIYTNCLRLTDPVIMTQMIAVRTMMIIVIVV